MLQGGAGGDEKQVINFAWPYEGGTQCRYVQVPRRGFKPIRMCT